MKRPVTFYCVLKSGCGDFYTPEHVAYLRDGLARSVTRPYDFVCLSDIDVPCDRVPLVENWPHHWSKVELFRPGVADPARLNVYIDLDVLVMGRLDPLLDLPHRFTMTADDVLQGRANSSIILWTGDYSGIYRRMKDYPVSTQLRFQEMPYLGDQALMEEYVTRTGAPPDRIEDLCPGALRIFRRPGDMDGVEKAMLLSFVGPRPQKPGGAEFEKLAAQPGTEQALIRDMMRGLPGSDLSRLRQPDPVPEPPRQSLAQHVKSALGL